MFRILCKVGDVGHPSLKLGSTVPKFHLAYNGFPCLHYALTNYCAHNACCESHLVGLLSSFAKHIEP